MKQEKMISLVRRLTTENLIELNEIVINELNVRKNIIKTKIDVPVTKINLKEFCETTLPKELKDGEL